MPAHTSCSSLTPIATSIGISALDRRGGSLDYESGLVFRHRKGVATGDGIEVDVSDFQGTFELYGNLDRDARPQSDR